LSSSVTSLEGVIPSAWRMISRTWESWFS
jgi:hypothetical protein